MSKVLSTTRRRFMGTTVAGAALAPLALATGARAEQSAMTYEIVRSEEEWRSMLSEDEFHILREGGTENQYTSPLASDFSEGTFHCKGCDLTLYSSRWREDVDKGWVFFRHGEPDTLLMTIDGPQEAYDQPALDSLTNIECHCRRCGSHMGHILNINNVVLHCINGTALTFTATEA